VLADDDRRAERAKRGGGRVVLRQIEDADRAEVAEETQERLRVAGELEELHGAAGAKEGGAAVGGEPASVAVVRDRVVGALPRLA
jgi:hypothetical protein